MKKYYVIRAMMVGLLGSAVAFPVLAQELLGVRYSNQAAEKTATAKTPFYPAVYAKPKVNIQNVSDLHQLPATKGPVKDPQEVRIDSMALKQASPDDLKNLKGKFVVLKVSPDAQLPLDKYAGLGTKIVRYVQPSKLRFENMSAPGVRSMLDGITREHSAQQGKNGLNVESPSMLIDLRGSPLDEKALMKYLRSNPHVKTVSTKNASNGASAVGIRTFGGGIIALSTGPATNTHPAQATVDGAIPTPVNGQITDSVADKPHA